MSWQGMKHHDKRTHIIHDGVRFGHQSSDGRCMHDLAMRTREARPERSHMHFELVKPVCADALEEGIQVVLEPRPHFAGRDALRRCGVCA